jgi:hypothetical protein
LGKNNIEANIKIVSCINYDKFIAIMVLIYKFDKNKHIYTMVSNNNDYYKIYLKNSFNFYENCNFFKIINFHEITSCIFVENNILNIL